MRQVFTSARLETVEGVAALLNEHGIETYISDGRSYSGNRRRVFTYRDNAPAEEQKAQAAVWVTRSENLTQARILLRDAGLMGSTRESFLPDNLQIRHKPQAKTSGRIRLGLLAVIVLVAIVSTSRGCNNASKKPLEQPVQSPVEIKVDEERHIEPVEVSL